MDKSILISIHPQHVLNILNGKKTLELRKVIPSGFKGWVYIYCTKSKKFLHMTEEQIIKQYPATPSFLLNDDVMITGFDILNGKVVARFWFDEYKKLEYHKKNEVLMWDNNYYFYTEEDNTYCNVQYILDELCLEHQQVLDYGKEKDLFAWHIKKLKVFDIPMSLNELHKTIYYPNGENMTPDICLVSNSLRAEYQDLIDVCLKSFEVKKAPQSWQYVWRIEQ